MSLNPKGAKKRKNGRPGWTYARALAAVPYVLPIVRSLREHRLELQALWLRARRLANRPGRPDRQTLIAQQELQQAIHAAEQAFEDALRELHTLDLVCEDPIQGVVLYPIQYSRKPVWLIFDLFEPGYLRFWRYQDEGPEVRRPINAGEPESPEGLLA